MADGLNRVILIGNLGQDPELRQTQNSAVLNIRMATSEGYLDKSGERQERTEWHTVVVWGKRAEGLSKVLAKGDRICVEGGLRTRSWEANDGTKRYATEVVAAKVLLLGSAQKRDGGDKVNNQRQPGIDDPGEPPPPYPPDDFPF